MADKAAQSAVAERLHWLLSALLPSALCALDVRAAQAPDASVKVRAGRVQGDGVVRGLVRRNWQDCV